MLSEQPHGTVTILIHLVHQGISIFWKTGGEDNQLIISRHYFQKVVDTWPFLHINATHIAFNIYWNNIVWIFNLIELTVYQCFIQIQYQRFKTSRFFRLWPKKSIVGLLGSFWSPRSLRSLLATTLGLRTILLASLARTSRLWVDLALWHLRYHCFQFLLQIYIE